MSEATFVGVTVPAAIMERLAQDERTRGEAEGKSPKALRPHIKLAQAYVEKLLEEALGGARPDVLPPPEPATLPLADACATVLKHLHPEHAKLIQELAAEKQMSMVPFVMSPITFARDHGRVGVLAPEWLEKEPVTIQPETKQVVKAGVCEYCGNGVKVGTRFCPPPEDGGDSCGRKAAMKVTYDMRDRNRPRKNTSPFAPKPSALVKQFTAEHSYQSV